LQHVLLPLISDSPFVHTAAHDSLRACTNDRLWSLQASLSEHKVIESKPDNTVEDLRFHQPWTELQDFADSIDLSSADDIMHKHIPYGDVPTSMFKASLYQKAFMLHALQFVSAGLQ